MWRERKRTDVNMSQSHTQTGDTTKTRHSVSTLIRGSSVPERTNSKVLDGSSTLVEGLGRNLDLVGSLTSETLTGNPSRHRRGPDPGPSVGSGRGPCRRSRPCPLLSQTSDYTSPPSLSVSSTRLWLPLFDLRLEPGRLRLVSTTETRKSICEFRYSSFLFFGSSTKGVTYPKKKGRKKTEKKEV